MRSILFLHVIFVTSSNGFLAGGTQKHLNEPLATPLYREPPANPDQQQQQTDSQKKLVPGKKQTKQGLLGLILTATGGQGLLLVRPVVWLWRRLPHRLPKWWRTTGLTDDALGQIAFMLSNVAYLGAGYRLMQTREAPPMLGVLMLLVCAASCAYHAAQCLHGTDAEPTARACTVDTALALGTAGYAATQVHIELANAALAALSLAFFQDVFSLGYTTSHSLWHLSTAALAIASRPLAVPRQKELKKTLKTPFLHFSAEVDKKRNK